MTDDGKTDDRLRTVGSKNGKGGGQGTEGQRRRIMKRGQISPLI